MKRNTTPTLCVSINVDKDSIKEIEFIFKAQNNERSDKLISKKFTSETMKTSNGISSGEVFFYIDFTAKETMKLPEGTIYMDTRILTNQDKILETEIVSFDMHKTLFSEVYDL